MGQRESCCDIMPKSVLLMFYSKSFIVSGLTFKSFIHFEFIFVYDVRPCSSFVLLHIVDKFSQYHLLKRLSFLHCIFLPSLSKTGVYGCVDLSLDFLFGSSDLCFCFCAGTKYCLDDGSFVVLHKV